jgi:sialic acid synthase
MRELFIDGVRIADDTDCYVIAEIGHNHQGSLSICKEMFDAAKLAGCNAVKLQKRDNRTLYTQEFYDSPYNSENAFGATYGLHREALEFDRSQYQELQGYARTLGITFFATAFDVPSAEFLRELGVPCFKVASGDVGNKDLLERLGSYGKPVILSTGGAAGEDVKLAVDRLSGCHLGVLHCTSGYPAEYSELNLKVIRSYRQWFPETVIGWSAHDTGIHMPMVAYAFGARIIEKHFTLNRAWRGTDQSFSLEPQGMKTMIDNLKDCRKGLGDGIKRRYESENAGLAKQAKNAQGQIDGRSV